jgi:PAS domain S-box-containing protein
MPHPLRILSIEDDPKDTKLIQDLLETEDIVCEITRVDTQAALLASLKQGGMDLILADYTLPSFDGISALKLAMKACPEVPFIFVSGTLGEEVAIEALKIGATDYVLKTRLSRLVPSVVRALREARERAERKQADEKLRRSEAYLTEAQRLSQTGSFGCNLSTGEMFWSEETFRIYGYDRSTQPAVERVLQRVHPEDKPLLQEHMDRASREGKACDVECRLLLPDDSVKHVRIMAHASKNESGNIEFIGAVMDVTATKQAEEKLRRSEAYLAEAQILSHTGSFGWNVCSGDIHWSRETFRIFEYEPAAKAAIDMVLQRTHPEDRSAVKQLIDHVSRERTEFDLEHRLLMPDGSVKYLRVIGSPSENEDGCFEFVGAVTDITERKRAETLRDGESRILEMIARDAPLEEILEKLVRVVEAQFAGLLCSVLLLDEDGQHVRHGAAPSLPKAYTKAIDGLCIGPKAGSCGTAMYRREPVVVTDILQDPLWEPYRGVAEPYGFRACWSTPILEHSGKVLGSFAMYYREPRSPSPAETRALEMATHLAGIAIERKRAEETLRASEGYLAEAQRLTHTGSWVWEVERREAVHLSEEWYRIYGFDPEDGMPGYEKRVQRVHPEDRAKWQEAIERAIREKSDYEVEYRILLPDGTAKYINAVGHPVFNASGDLVQFVGSSTDITERKHAEERIREQELEFRQVLDLAPQHVTVLGPDGSRLYLNQSGLDYYGLTLEEWRACDTRRFFHPDDLERMMSGAQIKLLSGSPHEVEARILRNDGKYRWFLIRRNPLRDEQGRITRWYAAGTDIHDRKQAEERLQHENVALREEIDKASMFEEIVGTSPALQTVLSHVSKVAPTSSTVLITGETGTGKELVARAIHRRSQRSSQAFVSVNCAAIPRDLITSELFGHEKGAFTGATQRRLGRFELAEGGTIFLDEVGELPAETQIALLRVLQEHEFERVGGTRSIRTDVRVIAATNRDLQAAITAGGFRSDLFYRLNVFPIEVPPLRKRQKDIPMLVEYFIDRYARKAGKSIRSVNKRSLDLLQSYPWPGNIRELQNVIERSVIVCDTENFSVDESWLSRQPLATEAKSQLDLSEKLAAQEKEIIEAALRECGGQVFGPSGAATKLGMPRSTLESKIRSLKIDKNLFKTAAASKNS